MVNLHANSLDPDQTAPILINLSGFQNTMYNRKWQRMTGVVNGVNQSSHHVTKDGDPEHNYLNKLHF